MDEIWVPIKYYEGYYEVSNIGNIRSIKRTIKYRGDGKGSGIHIYPSIILRPCLNSVGYYQVSLSINNNRRRYMIHRLVADAFCYHQKGKDYVNHIDGNYLNNRYNNLEWVSCKENVCHAIVNGFVEIYGEDSHFSKFTNQQADIIRSIKKKGITTKELSILLGVNKSCINRINNGETYNINNKPLRYKNE